MGCHSVAVVILHVMPYCVLQFRSEILHSHPLLCGVFLLYCKSVCRKARAAVSKSVGGFVRLNLETKYLQAP